MVAESESSPNTSRKPHGSKKIFSVPVVKLRRKIAKAGRNGSSSRSGSKNASHRKLLLRNNRELALALTCEKERFRCLYTENVGLKAQLHETNLEVHGLKKQLTENQDSLSSFKDSVLNHLRDAVRHSVSLTESLKLAMGLCYGERKAVHQTWNFRPGYSTLSSGQPVRQRVNPMVGGLTIKHPTINLRRIVLTSERRALNTNEAPSENLSLEPTEEPSIEQSEERTIEQSEEQTIEQSEEQMHEQSEEQSIEEHSETMEDISESIEEAQGRPGGLSTCVEEDEECIEDTILNMIDDTEESDEEDNSIRRKVVSFRNATLEKDRNKSGLESISGQSSTSNETLVHVSLQSTILNQNFKKNGESSSNDKVPNVINQSCVPYDILKKIPVVALNDISKFLQNSNSVNVQKVILNVDSSELRDQLGGKLLEEAGNGKENCPKSAPRKKLGGKKRCANPGSGSHFSNGTDEVCVEGNAESNHFSIGEMRDSLTNVAAISVIKMKPLEDPLEGTSWMHSNLLTGNETRTKKRDKTKCSEEECPKASEPKRSKGNGGKGINSSKEEFSGGHITKKAQEDTEILMNHVLGPSEEYDISSFEFGIQNCPMAQSTPMNQGKSSKDRSSSDEMDESKPSSKSNRGSTCYNALRISNGSNASGDNQVKEVGKCLVVPPVDTKLDSKAFVTVRIKKINIPDLSPMNSVNLPDLSPTNGVENNLAEVDNCANSLSDEVVDFIGFDVTPESQERLQAMKKLIINGCEIQPKENNRSCGVQSVCSASVTQESQLFVESTCCEVSGGEQGRPRRKAAPSNLKERSLNKKLRR